MYCKWNCHVFSQCLRVDRSATLNHLIFQNNLYYICWSTCALYSTATAAECAPGFCITLWHFSWQMSHSDVPECPHLIGVSRKYEFNMTMCNYFLQSVCVAHCYLSKPHTRWFKYDRDWFVCKQAALRSSCATLREWSHNLHPPSCSG